MEGLLKAMFAVFYAAAATSKISLMVCECWSKVKVIRSIAFLMSSVMSARAIASVFFVV